MTTQRIHARLTLAMLLLAAPTGLAALPEPDAGPQPAGMPPVRTPADGLVFRTDADGHRTLTSFIEDDPAGSSSYVSPVSISVTAPPPVGRWSTGDTMTYAKLWSYRNHDRWLVTLGVAQRDDSGIITRVPLAVVESASPILHSELLNVLISLTWISPNNLTGMGWQGLFPSDVFRVGRADGESSPNLYYDSPIVYLWTMKKRTLYGDVWEGAYGAGESTKRGSSRQFGFHAEKTWEFGHVVRVGADTRKVGGAYLTIREDFFAGDYRARREYWIEAGLQAGTGTRVPLAYTTLTDEREGSDASMLWERADEQTNRYRVGTYVAGSPTPLLEVRTDAKQGTAAGLGPGGQDRTTQVGAWVGGAFVPLVGAHFLGENRTLLGAAIDSSLAFGTPGIGEWTLSGGVFGPDGAFVPLTGVRYVEDFAPAHRYTHHGLVAPGVFDPLGGFQGLAAFAWDGEDVPLLALQDPTLAWMASAGVLPLDGYVPVWGASYERSLPPNLSPRHAERGTWATGVFAGDYATFIPVLGATYDGESPPVLGVPAGNWTLSTGAFAAGAYTPVVGARHEVGVPGASARYGTSETTTVGAFAGSYDAYVGLAAVAYDGEGAPVPAVTSGEAQWMLSAGVLAGGAYLPVVGIEHRNALPGNAEGAYDEQKQLTVGTFLASYDAYAPLIAVGYDGDSSLVGIAQDPETEWRVSAGAAPAGEYVPIAGVEHGSGRRPGDPRTEREADRITVGAFPAGYGSFTGVATVVYEGETSIVGVPFVRFVYGLMGGPAAWRMHLEVAPLQSGPAPLPGVAFAVEPRSVPGSAAGEDGSVALTDAQGKRTPVAGYQYRSDRTLADASGLVTPAQSGFLYGVNSAREPYTLQFGVYEADGSWLPLVEIRQGTGPVPTITPLP